MTQTPDATTPTALFSRSQKIALLATLLIYGAAAVAAALLIDRRVLDMVMDLPWTLIATLLLLSLANYLARTWRWVALGRFLSLDVPVRNNALYYLSGFALTTTPGKAGEAVRLWFLKSGHDVPYGRSLPLMLADRILDMWAVLILAALSIVAFANYVWQGVILAGIVLAASVPILWPMTVVPMLRWAHGLAPRLARTLVRVRRMLHAMTELVRWRAYGLTLLPSIGGWLAECAALYLLMQQLGAPISMLEAVFVFSFSVIVGAVSMLPGGLGSTEATIVILLRAVGVDLDTAIAATAMIRITTFWFAVGLGALAMPAALHAARAPRVNVPT